MRDETVPCTWCGKPTTFTGTRLCNPHWELLRRIESEPEMAARMLAGLSSDGGETSERR